jgi:hypothetical protein
MGRMFRILIWGVLAIFSIGLGIWQRNNIGTVFREYYSLNYHFNSGGAIIERIIPKRAHVGPELMAIARVSVRLWDTQLTKCVPEITRYAVEFPNNQFFLNLTARACSFPDDAYYSSEISLLCANRLIQLDPNNGLYYYVKACALLVDRKGDDIEPALVTLEKANSCPKFEDPFAAFRPALISLAESGKLRKSWIETAFSSPRYDIAYSYELRRELLRYSASAITNGNTSLAFRIDDDIIAMDKRIRHVSIGSWLSAATDEPAALELFRVNLSPDRAMRNRMLLVKQYVASNQKERQTRAEEREPFSNLFFAPGTAFMQLLFGCGVIAICFASIGLMGGLRNSASISTKHYLFFIFAVLTYVFAYTFFEYYLYRSNLMCCYSYFDEFRPSPISTEYFFDDLADAAKLLSAICAPIAAIGVYGLLSLAIKKLSESFRDELKRICAGLLITSVAIVLAHIGFSGFYSFEHNLFNVPLYIFLFAGGVLFRSRFLWIALFASIFASASSILGYWFFFRLLAAVCFVLLCAVYSLAYDKTKLETIRQVFSKTNSLRLPAIQLAAAGLVLSWLGFLCFVPSLASAITYYSKAMSAHEPPKYPRSPVPMLYEGLIERLRTEPNIAVSDFQAIPLLEPNDVKEVLPCVIAKASSMKPNPRFGDWTQIQLSDRWLYQNAVNSPEEIGRLFIPYFKNPDSNLAAVAKAITGDRSQKRRLFVIFNNYVENEIHPPPPSKWSKPGILPRVPPGMMPGMSYIPQPEPDNPYIGDVVRAMILLDPNETATCLIDKMGAEPKDIVDMCHFSQYGYLLPRQQLNKVIDAYVDRLLTKFEDPKRKFVNCNGALLAMAESSLAPKILKIVIDDSSRRDYMFLCNLEPKLDKTAIPLLKQGLVSKNPKLRAWCLWQIYRLDPAADLDFDKLANDPEPSVRANAVMFKKCPMPKQPDSLCQLIRKLKT